MTRLRVGGATDVGLVRAANEDQLLVAEPLFAVADGMGGHAAGEVASLTAVEALRAAFDGNRSSEGLADAVRNANHAVFEQAARQPDLRGMGTTLTAAALVDEDGEEIFTIVNVGDSRAYLWRDGHLDQLTEDHSVPEELRRAGRISAEEAAADPRRHVLTRVLGIDPEVDVDTFQVVPYKGDRLLLASDGLFGEVPDREIAAVLRRNHDPDTAARRLVELANDFGGTDNVTVLVIDVVDDEDRAYRASQAVEVDTAVDLRPAVAPPGAGAEPADEADSEGAVSVAPQPAPPAVEVPAPESQRRRRVTLAGVALVAVVALLLSSAAAAVVVYARGTYYVGLSESQVAIFQGRPRGLLWFEPTLKERTGVFVEDIRPSRVEDLRRGKGATSLPAARRYVRNIREEAAPPPPAPPPPAPAP